MRCLEKKKSEKSKQSTITHPIEIAQVFVAKYVDMKSLWVKNWIRKLLTWEDDTRSAFLKRTRILGIM